MAAISAADPQKWTPRDLPHVAAEQLADATTDEDHRIPPGDYARLITYTVDAFTHRLQARLGMDFDGLPATQDAPPDPDEEAPAPARPARSLRARRGASTLRRTLSTSPRPKTSDAFEYGSEEYAGLQFGRPLSKSPYTRIGHHHGITYCVARRVPRTVCADIKVLDADIRAGIGPAVRAAADDLLRKAPPGRRRPSPTVTPSPT